MKLLIVFGLLLLQACRQFSTTGTVVCDGTKIALPVSSKNEAEERGAEIETNDKMGDQTLLLFRMLNTL